MKKLLIFAIIFPLLTSACGIYSEYKRPELAVVDSLYSHIPPQAISTDSSSIAFLTWEELFTDSLLRNYIRIGLEHNTDLNIARLKVKEAEATLEASRLAFLPSATLNADLSFSNSGSSRPRSAKELSASSVSTVTTW